MKELHYGIHLTVRSRAAHCFGTSKSTRFLPRTALKGLDGFGYARLRRRPVGYQQHTAILSDVHFPDFALRSYHNGNEIRLWSRCPQIQTFAPAMLVTLKKRGLFVKRQR